MLGLGVLLAAATVCAAAVVAAGDAGRAGRDAPRSSGLTNRGRFLPVPLGRSHAEVANLLGPPLMTRTTPDAEPGTDCWLYASQSGLPIRYELCFRGGFLQTKAIVPAPPRRQSGR